MEFGTSYFGVRDLDHARRDLDRFAASGLNAVLHTFSERDLRYYSGTVRKLVEASHERNLRVYLNPWGVGRVFGGEALSEFPSRHPEACQLLSSGDRAPAACLNAPAFRNFMKSWIEAAVETGPDVLFWDEPHWFTSHWRESQAETKAWVCRCPACKERYRAVHDRPIPEEFDGSVQSFRELSMLDFLDEMMEFSGREDMKNAVCVMPGDGSERGLDRWEELASSPHLDILATTPYWALHGEDPETFVSQWTRAMTRLAPQHGKQSQIWIQGFSLPGTEEALRNVRTATRTALSGNPDSIFLWGWDGCRVISSIACGNPMAVWKAYLEEINRLS